MLLHGGPSDEEDATQASSIGLTIDEDEDIGSIPFPQKESCFKNNEECISSSNPGGKKLNLEYKIAEMKMHGEMAALDEQILNLNVEIDQPMSPEGIPKEFESN